MSEKSCFIIGLPSAGKTTFLAALAFSLIQKDEETKLRWKTFSENSQYLTELSRAWLAGKPVERTNDAIQQMKLRLDLLDQEGQAYQTAFPDLSGEVFQKCCTDREIDRSIATAIEQSDGIMLFVNPRTIKEPELIVDIDKELREGDEAGDAEEPLPSYSVPTEVQLVELLQFVDDIRAGKRVNLTIVVSAWDLIQDEAKEPEQVLQGRLPLLWQYLHTNPEKFFTQFFGVSAQGGSYESKEAVDQMLTEHETAPIKRILVVNSDGDKSYDITYLLWKTLN